MSLILPTKQRKTSDDHQKGPPSSLRLRDEPRPHGDQQRLREALRPCAVYRKITNGFRSEWAPRSTPT